MCRSFCTAYVQIHISKKFMHPNAGLDVIYEYIKNHDSAVQLENDDILLLRN